MLPLVFKLAMENKKMVRFVLCKNDQKEVKYHLKQVFVVEYVPGKKNNLEHLLMCLNLVIFSLVIVYHF